MIIEKSRRKLLDSVYDWLRVPNDPDQIRYTINWTTITVNGVDQFIFVAGGNVVGGLVNGVHQDGGQVDHHEDTQEVPVKM